MKRLLPSTRIPPWIAIRVAIALLLPRGINAADSVEGTNASGLVNLSLQELMEIKVESVTTASKYEQKVSDAPASISVVTREQIQQHGYRNFLELLNSVRGIYTTYDRNYGYVGIRGFNRPGDYNSRLLLLVDGVRINDNIYDSFLAEQGFPVDIDLIDRVEVIRGPSSSLYGSSAFFGVINVQTRRGRDVQHAEGSLTYGSFDTYSGRLSIGKHFTNGLEFLASGSFYESAGPDKLFYREFDDLATNDGIAEHRDYERTKKFFASLSYSDFTLEGLYTTREKGIPTGSYGTIFNDPREETLEKVAFVDLKYDHQFGDDSKFLARVNWNWYDYDGKYPYEYTPPVGPASSLLNIDKSFGDWIGAEAHLSHRVWDRLTLIGGTELRENYHQNQANYDRNPHTVYVDQRRDSLTVGVFGQAEFALLTNLTLSAGLRFDHYERFGEAYSPRLGLIYHPWEKSTFKFLYGEAFRAPNLFEAYYLAPDFKTDPSLGPETIQTYEVVYEQQLGRHLRFTSSAFYYSIDDLISQVQDPNDNLFVYRNIDQVEALGYENELEARFANGVRGGVSYTIQKAWNSRTDAELSNSPRHLGKARIAFPLGTERVMAGFDLLVSSSAKTVTPGRADAYWLLNGTLFSAQLSKGLELSASVYNIFDRRYAFPVDSGFRQSTIEQDGRTFRLKLTYRY